MLIINGKIFTMEGKPIDNGFVRIKKNLIEETGEMSALKKNKKRKNIRCTWSLGDARAH